MAIEPSPSWARAAVSASRAASAPLEGGEKLLLRDVEPLESDLDERAVDALGGRHRIEGRRFGIEHPKSVSVSGDDQAVVPERASVGASAS